MAVEEWIVQKGDNIWDIAGQLLTAQGGQPPSLEQQVAEMNRIISLNLGQLNNNPDLIKPGQKLKVGAGAPSPGTAINNGKGKPQQSANPEGEGVGGSGNIANGGRSANTGSAPSIGHDFAAAQNAKAQGGNPQSQYPESEGVPPGGNIAPGAGAEAGASAGAGAGGGFPTWGTGVGAGAGAGASAGAGGGGILDRLIEAAARTAPGRLILQTPYNQQGMRLAGGMMQRGMNAAPVYDTAPNRWAVQMLQKYGGEPRR